MFINNNTLFLVFLSLGIYFVLYLIITAVVSLGRKIVWVRIKKGNITVQFENAYKSNNSHEVDKAEEELVCLKLEILGDPRTSSRDRKNCMDYIEQVAPSPSRAQVDLLKRALQNERRLDMQARLTHYLDSVLTKMNKSEADKLKTIPKLRFGKMVNRFDIALSIWLTELIMGCYLWMYLDSISIIELVMIGILAWLATFFSIVVSISIHKMIPLSLSVLASISVVLLYLVAYSEIYHTNTSLVPLTDQETNFTVTADYPRWITADDIDPKLCHGQVVVKVSGKTQPDIYFNYDKSIFYAYDENCEQIIEPHILPTQPVDLPYVFHLIPKSQSVLLQGKTRVSPDLLEGSIRTPLTGIVSDVLLEHPFWNVIRTIVFVATGGSSTLIILQAIIWLISKFSTVHE